MFYQSVIPIQISTKQKEKKQENTEYISMTLADQSICQKAKLSDRLVSITVI